MPAPEKNMDRLASGVDTKLDHTLNLLRSRRPWTSAATCAIDQMLFYLFDTPGHQSAPCVNRLASSADSKGR